ncbi:ArnT family glycosyltransferase [Actinopolyspora halophila]|uniref:ArnT family glycosyltransferase n=1 Tax=Actinopolyspora halophila TaxID=1850 RepID=UPI0003767B8A|nr:glycosyltransferase family 39 protein [Actinopolyspora halophila]
MSTAPPAPVGTTPQEANRRAPATLPRFAWVPITALALGFFTVGMLVASRYGYFGDELYFLAAGDHPAPGYVDQPPGVPLVARAMQTLFPDSLVALRLPSLLITIGYIVVAALTTRELGGKRLAQTCVAGACILAPHFVGSAHLLVTYSFDQALWAWILWLVVRWTRKHQQGESGDLLLIGAGLVTAVTLQFKLLVPALWLMLVLTAVLFGPRRLALRPGLWVAGVLSVLSALPGLLWQIDNGWPQLEMAEVVDSETGGVTSFLRVLFTQVGPIGGTLTVVGLYGLLFRRHLSPYRFIGVTVVALTALFAMSSGRSYYLAGCYAVLFAAATVVVQHWWQQRPATATYRWLFRGWTAAVALSYAFAAQGAINTLPIVPVSEIRPGNVVATASLGWEPITTQIAERYRALPDGVPTAVITHDYWSASALHHFGPEHGLSDVYSPSRGFWYFDRPDEDVERVVYLGSDREQLEKWFGDVRKVGTVETDLDAATYYEDMRIWVAGDPKEPWSQLWPRLHHMSLW